MTMFPIDLHLYSFLTHFQWPSKWYIGLLDKYIVIIIITFPLYVKNQESSTLHSKEMMLCSCLAIA